MKVRPIVLAFAQAMESKLREYDGERGDSWKQCSPEWLAERVDEEIVEMAKARKECLVEEWPHGRPDFISEAADVANFLMFFAHQTGALTDIPRPEPFRAAALSGSAPRESEVTEAMAKRAAKKGAELWGEDAGAYDEFWDDIKDEWVAILTAALAPPPDTGTP